MSLRGILVYAVYGGVVLLAAFLLVRGIGAAALAPPVAPSNARAALSCEDLVDTLHHELWTWFIADVRAAGPEPYRRGPLPGALAEWEALRHLGAERCHSGKTREQFDHLLALRRALENQSYLLSTTVGADIAALR